jgi:hypothetical protein
MSTGKTLSWVAGGVLLGVLAGLAGFAGELFRRQPANRVQQRYVAPPASSTTGISAPAPHPERPSPDPAPTAG